MYVIYHGRTKALHHPQLPKMIVLSLCCHWLLTGTHLHCLIGDVTFVIENVSESIVESDERSTDASHQVRLTSRLPSQAAIAANVVSYSNIIELSQ